jgi:hypothetical protein
MMREQDINILTNKMLARLNAPRAVAGNPEAMKDEALFLCKTINNLAPSKNYKEWFNDFEEAVLGNLETRTWPTIKELKKAAKQIAPLKPHFTDLTGDNIWKLDPLKIAAKRIKNLEGVEETYVTGSGKQKLLRMGLIVEEDLNPYLEAKAYSKSY